MDVGKKLCAFLKWFFDLPVHENADKPDSLQKIRNLKS
jgi:hypothetical protein